MYNETGIIAAQVRSTSYKTHTLKGYHIMTVKSIHQNTDTTSTIVDSEPSTALVPVAQEDTQAVAFSTLTVEQFDKQLRSLEMWTSYTGPVPAALEEYYNLEIKVKGMIRQQLSNTNEETGEVKTWSEIRMKLEDDKIIAASGIGANQFAEVVLPSLGQGDWPVAMRVMVKARTLKSGNKMPTFQVLGKA
jgi:hypothetical protein